MRIVTSDYHIRDEMAWHTKNTMIINAKTTSTTTRTIATIATTGTIIDRTNIQQGEEYSDNDNADYFDEYERIQNTLYQNGYLQHIFNASEMRAADIGATCSDNNNQNNADASKPHTNTSSSQSSSSNQSDALGFVPNYQPRWHQQLMHSSFAIRNPLHPSIIKAHLDSVNHEIAQLDSRIENILLKQHQAMSQQAIAEAAETNASTIYRNPVDQMTAAAAAGNGVIDGKTNSPIPMPTAANQATVISASPIATATTAANIDNKFANMTVSSAGSNGQMSMHSTSKGVQPLPRRYPTQYPPNIDSDTEHIYETIPEDSESEPIYCSPYRGETDVEQNIVHDWLGMKNGGSGGNDGRKRAADCTKTNWTRNTTKSNSSVEDQSSSAYNTGGSCNSNHQLTLELSDTNNDDGNKTLVFCPTKHLLPKFPAQMSDSKSPVGRQAAADVRKDKVTSPTHNNRRADGQMEQAAAAKKVPMTNQGRFLHNAQKSACRWLAVSAHLPLLVCN